MTQQNPPLEPFDTRAGRYILERLPKQNKQSGQNLRAWDAADELLINTLFADYAQLLTPTLRCLIINDSFGALAVALHPYSLCCWSDSYLSHQATRLNASNNALQLRNEPTYLAATENPTGCFDLVLIKIPKTRSLLEDQLYRLKPLLTEQTVIIGAAMSKHIHRSTLQLFENIIGRTHTSLATKKARLIFSENTLQAPATASPYPKTIYDEPTGLRLINYANVFSNERLDIGTRFFIAHLKKCPTAERIIDLGCGNGALGIRAKALQNNAHICFIDESYNALASAKASFELAFNEQHIEADASYIASDALTNYSGEPPALILCNPPFHQAHSIGDHIAWAMFTQSKQTLAPQGELWVIGNRHLAYHTKLKRIFGHCEQVAANKKFVILKAKKR